MAATDAASFRVITGDVLTVFVTTNLTSSKSERRFSKGISVSELKAKLELITGASPATMEITVLHERTNAFICKLDDERLLGSYSIDDGMRLHVVDTDASNSPGAFEDVSKVEKYNLSESQYDERSDSVRNFLKRNNMGKYNGEELERRKQEREKEETEQLEMIEKEIIKVGDRCEVDVAGSGGKRRGMVMFVGKTEFSKSGHWIGVRFDEPLGKNDGSVKGKRYFECLPKYGGFVKPCDVKVGDFPELELEEFSDADEM